MVVAEPEAAPVAGLALRPVKPEAARLPAPVAVPDAVMAEVAGSAEYELLGPEAASDGQSDIHTPVNEGDSPPAQ